MPGTAAHPSFAAGTTQPPAAGSTGASAPFAASRANATTELSPLVET